MNMQAAQFIPDIIDIEASGFGSHSYPIEVGIVSADGSRYCRLIKLFAAWQHWDDSAEAVHGISRDLLCDKGHQGEDICNELNRLYANRILYSDAWVVDYPWLRTLFEKSDIEMHFRLSSIELLLKESQCEQWADVKHHIETQLQLTRHRASNDAHVIQQTYLTLTQV